MSVNAVRKQSSDEEVQTLAKSLIKSWKRLLGRCVFSCFQLSFLDLSGFEKDHAEVAEVTVSRLEAGTDRKPMRETCPCVRVVSDCVLLGHVSQMVQKGNQRRRRRRRRALL